MAPPARRVDGGVVCAACDRLRASTEGRCCCGQIAPLIRGLCVACRLRERVAGLAAGADHDAAVALAPFLEALAATPNAASTLRWTYVPGFDVCRRLLAGELPVTHAGVDQAAVTAPRAAAFLRAKLIDSGVLAARDPQAASFAAWQQRATLQIAAGVDRGQVRAYTIWQVASQLAARERRGEISYASQKYARSLVSEAIKLTSWLHQQQLALADLRQDLVDEWVIAGDSTRRRVRLFLAWLARAGVIARLHVAWSQDLVIRAAISDRDRLAMLARLLYDDTLAATDRLAGCLLLLYAQPLTRIVTLKTSDLSPAPDGVIQIRLGRGTVQLPEPLAIAVRQALERRAALLTDGAWLLPGRHAGAHVSADALRQRLRRIGVERTVNGRHWARLAGATYPDYVRIRNHTMNQDHSNSR